MSAPAPYPILRAMLKVGERAPEFSLPDQDGRDVSLTSLLNSGALILWFFSGYPTPANRVVARRIAELHAHLHRQGLVVAGMSPLPLESLARLHSHHRLPFPLLSDPEKAVARMYDVNGLLGFGVRRSTFLISCGRIVLGSVVEPLRIDKHLAFMREAPERLLASPLHF